MLTLVTRLARLMALIGGLVLTGLVVLTCASVIGRGLNTLGHSEWMTGTLPGLGEALIAKICHENWFRVLEKSWA